MDRVGPTLPLSFLLSKKHAFGAIAGAASKAPNQAVSASRDKLDVHSSMTRRCQTRTEHKSGAQHPVNHY